MNLVHAFLLFVFIAGDEGKRLASNDLYFYNVDDCTYFARALHKQGGDIITAYCLPRLVDPDKIKVY